MFGWLKKIFGAVKNFYVRSGLDKFLAQYVQVAVEVIAELALVNSNKAFHEWKDQAFVKIKERIARPVADNWIALLIGFGFEAWKAKQPGVPRQELK